MDSIFQNSSFLFSLKIASKVFSTLLAILIICFYISILISKNLPSLLAVVFPL